MSIDRFGLSFHHLGLAVKAPAETLLYLGSLGYSVGQAMFDPLQKVNLTMCTHPQMPDVEVIWPGDEASPIDKVIKRAGSGIYHLCYTCADPEAATAAMRSAGLRILPVAPPTPAILFGGARVSFYYIDNVGIIELIQGDSSSLQSAASRAPQ